MKLFNKITIDIEQIIFPIIYIIIGFIIYKLLKKLVNNILLKAPKMKKQHQQRANTIRIVILNIIKYSIMVIVLLAILAIYFAEHNKGPLHNVYMTFTANPHFQYINENDSLKTKVQKVFQTDYGLITNLEKAFEYLLQVAQVNEFTQKDMPDAIVVISDMEIDSPQYQNTDFFKLMKTKYAQAGYKLPKLVLWNVEARNDTFLSQDSNIIKVSGSSASTFKHLIGNLNGKTDWDIMIETLNNPWYNKVKVI